MPWEHCGQTISDDQPCGECGLTKDQWTVQFDATRTIQIATRKKKPFIKIQLVDPNGDEVPGVGFEVDLKEGETSDGVLDDYGYAKVTAKPGASCLLRFPDLDWLHVEPLPGKASTPKRLAEERAFAFTASPDVATFRYWPYGVLLELELSKTIVGEKARLRLVRDDGRVDCWRTRSDDLFPGEDRLELFYGCPDEKGTFALELDPSGDGSSSYRLFEGVPYAELAAEEPDHGADEDWEPFPAEPLDPGGYYGLQVDDWEPVELTDDDDDDEELEMLDLSEEELELMTALGDETEPDEGSDA